jgi:hypothetical protein
LLKAANMENLEMDRLILEAEELKKILSAIINKSS